MVDSHVAPTGDLAHNQGMCPDWESNWGPFGLQSTLNPLNHTSQGKKKKFFLRVLVKIFASNCWASAALPCLYTGLYLLLFNYDTSPQAGFPTPFSALFKANLQVDNIDLIKSLFSLKHSCFCIPCIV